MFIELYYTDLENFDKSIFLTGKDNLNSKIGQKQLQHLAGRYILNKIAKERFNIENIDLKYRDNKPYLQNSDIFFNISHSENIVIVAFSDLEIGVDVEYKNKKRNFAGVLERYKVNLQEFEKLSDEEKPDYFYTFWTRFEADLKLGKCTCGNYFTDTLKDDFIFTVASPGVIKKDDIIICEVRD